jgi:hypothetical protein
MKRIRTKEFVSKYGRGIHDDINIFLSNHENENEFKLIDIKYNQIIKDGDIYSYALVIIEMDY